MRIFLEEPMLEFTSDEMVRKLPLSGGKAKTMSTKQKRRQDRILKAMIREYLSNRCFFVEVEHFDFVCCIGGRFVIVSTVPVSSFVERAITNDGGRVLVASSLDEVMDYLECAR